MYTCPRGKGILSINISRDFIVSLLGVHGLAIATTGDLIRIYIISPAADPGVGREARGPWPPA